MGSGGAGGDTNEQEDSASDLVIKNREELAMPGLTVRKTTAGAGMAALCLSVVVATGAAAQEPASIITFQVPGAVAVKRTMAASINDAGAITGQYYGPGGIAPILFT